MTSITVTAARTAHNDFYSSITPIISALLEECEKAKQRGAIQFISDYLYISENKEEQDWFVKDMTVDFHISGYFPIIIHKKNSPFFSVAVTW